MTIYDHVIYSCCEKGHVFEKTGQKCKGQARKEIWVSGNQLKAIGQISK